MINLFANFDQTIAQENIENPNEFPCGYSILENPLGLQVKVPNKCEEIIVKNEPCGCEKCQEQYQKEVETISPNQYIKVSPDYRNMEAPPNREQVEAITMAEVVKEEKKEEKTPQTAQAVAPPTQKTDYGWTPLIVASIVLGLVIYSSNTPATAKPKTENKA